MTIALVVEVITGVMQMQLVIEIPEDEYECIKEDGFNGYSYQRNLFVEAISNGTPLPKGHGRLIEQPTDTDIAETIGGQNAFADCIREAVATVFENAKPVIEADGGDVE